MKNITLAITYCLPHSKTKKHYFYIGLISIPKTIRVFMKNGLMSYKADIKKTD